MNDHPAQDQELRERLAIFRDATAAIVPPASLLERLESRVPQRARLRRFVRDARAPLVVAALVGAGSWLWAHLDQRRLERDLYVRVGAWVEGP